MLSTVDNPYNPFTHFDEWNQWDMTHGYNTLAYLARVVVTSSDLSPADEALAVQQGMDDIIEEHSGGLYILVAPATAPVAAASVT